MTVNQDDPFGNYIDDDKTILRPNPGGRKPKLQEPVSPKPIDVRASEPVALPEGLHEQLGHSDANPLTQCALSLLSLVAQLRNTSSHPDIAGLRTSIINEVKRFETTSLQRGVPADQVQAARYCLCTLLDETVLNTPWGNNSLWSTQSLLITFHKEAWGGEKFFQILKNIMQQPGTHLHLLELLYFCLCLGFEGKYRVQEHGMTRLEEVRENLYQIIQRQRGDYEHELSISWQGIKDKRNALSRLVPLWVIGSVVGVTLMLVFLGFLYLINAASSPLLAKLYNIKDGLTFQASVTAPVTSPAPEPQASEEPAYSLYDDINTFLAPEIARGEIALDRKNGKLILRIMGKGFFGSGSDNITTRYLPLLDKIGKALSKVTDNILIVGHTDSDPIFSARFPSNWDLSQARAQSVAKVLSGNAGINATITSEGRAETQPLVPNDSAEHKAMNRRVDIIF
ncbi:MAG: type IVB secretion system protein IcmH/DotU [Methylicorpusculum sp.]|uniref:type IVB secretion system protein IcmH/DotU n=1 Tax=Methylicorpusculum sp. TaxID=2713644 RepID=UPI0027282C7A|nr:type IVB secretion system protein IcmH/DotU [Methylicorpusculum sp.]MDO8843654.1 type IVB secretion system protein IcmH/DotU [Methylicorpusculum sp.]MDO8939473.1 type IVB secretion system protein IcmH/DotU [Methylicorpusculum sp.]MDP2202998.1 type IVB secretion system protein IcmH/DotU [Methylicorpusculum sp.]